MSIRISRRAGIVSVLLAAVVSTYFLWPRASRSAPLREAREAVGQRDFDRAATRLDEHFTRWPDDADGHLFAAQCARRSDRVAEAEKHLRRFRELTGDDERFNRERLLLSAQQGELASLDGGFAVFKMKDDDPDAPLAIEALARGYMRKGQWGRARQWLQQWLDRKPERADRAQALTWSGQCRQRLGQFPEAVADFREAHRLDPAALEVRMDLAEMLIRSAPQEALDHLEAIAAREPNRLRVLIDIARAKRNLGDFDSVRPLLEELLRQSPTDLAALTEMAKLELDLRRPIEAETYVRKAEALAPNSHEVNATLLRCLVDQGKTAESDRIRAKLKTLEAELERRAAELISTGASPKATR